MSVLVAGVGNIFLSDDGFGVEVARRLAGVDLGPDVKVADFGIRGVHLAYELLDGYDFVILVDASPRGGEPGTLYVIEPESPKPPIPMKCRPSTPMAWTRVRCWHSSACWAATSIACWWSAASRRWPTRG